MRKLTFPRPAIFLAYVAGGCAIGLVIWNRLLRHSTRDLFHAHPVRRYAALGHLRAHPSVDAARALRDYVRWETRPLLRRRGEETLREMELYLE